MSSIQNHSPQDLIHTFGNINDLIECLTAMRYYGELPAVVVYAVSNRRTCSISVIVRSLLYANIRLRLNSMLLVVCSIYI